IICTPMTSLKTSIKTITYLSDTGCLEIQGASLISKLESLPADCLEFIWSLPENSVDLIVTDPPYFKVKPEGWDNQWKGDD
ncbi:hypothetical protein CSW67_27485, partial [Shigella boydii]